MGKLFGGLRRKFSLGEGDCVVLLTHPKRPLHAEPKVMALITPQTKDNTAIVLLAFGAFACMTSMRACDAMLPRLAQSFGTTTGQASHAISAYAIGYGLVQLLYGYIGDRYGKRKVIAIAATACMLGSLGTAASTSLSALIGFRALTGVTAAGVIPLSLAWLGDTVRYEKRQATIAQFLTGTISGLIGGQILGGVFADTVGWRWLFVLLAILFGAVGGLLLRQVRLDQASAVQQTTIQTTNQKGFFAQIVSVLRIPWTRVILLAVLLEGVVGFGPLAFIPAYIHNRFGMSLSAAGAILALFGAGGLLYTTLAKRLIKARGEAGLARDGGVIACVALILLLLGPTWRWALPACFLAGLGLYMLHNTLQANGTQMAPHARGMALALFASALFIGQSVGVSVGGFAIDHGRAPWLFAAGAGGLLLIGVTFAWALRERRRGLSAAPTRES